MYVRKGMYAKQAPIIILSSQQLDLYRLQGPLACESIIVLINNITYAGQSQGGHLPWGLCEVIISELYYRLTISATN